MKDSVSIILKDSPQQDDCQVTGDCPKVLYYFHPDHLGSSTFLIDAAGDPYQFMLYLPFGESMTDQKVDQYDTPYKYTGKELDEETGLFYFGARYYDPSVSQFMGVDQLADRGPQFSHTFILLIIQ